MLVCSEENNDPQNDWVSEDEIFSLVSISGLYLLYGALTFSNFVVFDYSRSVLVAKIDSEAKFEFSGCSITDACVK